MLVPLCDLFENASGKKDISELQLENAQLQLKVNGLFESNKELVENLRLARATIDRQSRTLFRVRVSLEEPCE